MLIETGDSCGDLKLWPRCVSRREKVCLASGQFISRRRGFCREYLCVIVFGNVTKDSPCIDWGFTQAEILEANFTDH